MKRYGDLYKNIYNKDNLRLAFKNAKRGKGNYQEIKKIEENLEYYINELHFILINKLYKTSTYEIFNKKCGNKIREIYKLPFYPDRITQWAILQIIEPIFIKNFTKDTYSAIPNRGIHLVLKNIKNDFKTKGNNMDYCLKLDVKKYYPNINHAVLKNKLKNTFKDKDLLWLLYEIIDSIEGEIGIPIGNYTSQYFGNFYLSKFDHWIKEELKIKSYFRYMDDICIFSNSKNELHLIKIEIEKYFSENLKLKIKENWQIFSTEIRGVDFVGYVIRKNYILLRKSIKINMIKKINKFKDKNNLSKKNILSIGSYIGWLKHCNGKKLYNKYIKELRKDIK